MISRFVFSTELGRFSSERLFDCSVFFQEVFGIVVFVSRFFSLDERRPFSEFIQHLQSIRGFTLFRTTRSIPDPSAVFAKIHTDDVILLEHIFESINPFQICWHIWIQDAVLPCFQGHVSSPSALCRGLTKSLFEF